MKPSERIRELAEQYKVNRDFDDSNMGMSNESRMFIEAILQYLDESLPPKESAKGEG